MDPPTLTIKILKICFTCYIGPRHKPGAKFSRAYAIKWLRIGWTTKGVQPEKMSLEIVLMKHSKIELRHVLS